MKKIIIIFAALLLIFTSCDTTDPKPPEEKLPGYQEDVPWPSLADSPWPMYHHDPQRTGRSKFEGPILGNVYKKIPALNMEATPIVLINNILCFTTSSPDTIYKYSVNGKLDWKHKLQFSTHTTPVVDRDQNIYVSCGKYLYKFSNDGYILWKSELDNNSGIKSAALSIDKDGNIYIIGGDNIIYVYDGNGNILWSYHEPRLFKRAFHAPSFSPDGKTIYLQGESVSLIALDVITQTIKWEFGENPLASAPLVDSQGNIYFTPSTYNGSYITLFSLTESGDIRWSINLYGNDYTSDEASIDKYGNIILGIGDTLYSISYNATLNWKSFASNNTVISSTINDINGNIFFTIWDPNRVVAFNKDGNKIWEIPIHNERLLYPPLLTADSKLVVPSFRSNYLYIIE